LRELRRRANIREAKKGELGKKANKFEKPDDWQAEPGACLTPASIRIPYNPLIIHKIKQPKTTVKDLLRKAETYPQMLKHGLVNSQAELARKEGVSNARITQFLDLNKLAPEIHDDYLKSLTDPEQIKYFNEKN
jgi:hypothetical protein